MNTKKKALRFCLWAALIALIVPLGFSSALLAQGKAAPEIKLESAGPIAFGPKGILLISDPMAATIYAVSTKDTEGSADGAEINVDEIKGTVGSMMGTTADDIRINDLAANPINGNVYLSVTRGSGDDEVSTICRVHSDGKISPFKLVGKGYTKAVLDNAVDKGKKDRRGNSLRMESITDMAFVDGTIYVAGLSNEEFASNLRSIPFPFKETDEGTAIEIYHGAHGAYETRSPVRTFTTYVAQEKMNLLAAYTCTPLVRIPADALKPGEKVRGETVAELGNWNRPLDMIVYQKDNKPFVLIANSARGVMKLELDGVKETKVVLTERVKRNGTAGVTYETVKDLQGVVQLDKLNDTHAVVLMQEVDDKGKPVKDGKASIKTIPLP